MFESIAYAAEGAVEGVPQPNQSMHMLIMMGLVFGIMYFMMIKPQQKKAKELQATINQLKKGDKVVTTGGILGTVSSLQDDYVVLNVGGSDTKIEVLKSAIAGLRQ